ncbi:hypothetical protein N665_0231s0034 [Sinapis alba]|nr:hypothetical protein N665_0231s0034 [Sinapis alba]
MHNQNEMLRFDSKEAFKSATTRCSSSSSHSHSHSHSHRDGTVPLEPTHHADHRAFILNFRGNRINVTVTNKAEAVRRWIRNTCYYNKNHLGRRRLIVGLGLGDEIKEDSVSTVHLCVGTECLIIQLDQLLEARHRLDLGLPSILANQFTDENIRFVGIFNGGHANKLDKAGIQFAANLHDVNDFLPYQENRSYKQVVEASRTRTGRSFHGFDLDPAITNSEWSKPDLDGPQISQAAADAFVRYKLGVEFVL